VEALGVGLETNIEMGMNFIRPVSVAVLWAMKSVYKFVPNYGWVIVIISILTKVLFYRLTHKSFKSIKEMQDLQPRIQALKEKYGADRRRLSEETMKLYKEAGVNPLGGCLPMLLQMPVFIALFNVLSYMIELRGAHFVGWITDLSQQDVLFKLPIGLPLIGDNFSLLPIIMGASMWAQSKLGGSPTGQPSPGIPPGFNTLLPIVFTVLFYKMPSGLVIYWTINTALSVVQQYYIVRDSRRKPAVAVVEEAPPVRKRARPARKSR
jgi:YidC/Oxa1 family membrane protein insertase